MKKIVINKLENAYGIKKMSVNLDEGNSLTQDVIYSRNGTFKTSFSKCLYNLSLGKNDCINDRVTDIPADIDIEIINGEKISKSLINEFLVFSRDIYEKNPRKISDYEKELELITVNQKDKKYIHDLINGDLEEPILEMKVHCKKIDLDYEKTIELLSDTNKGDLDNIIDILKYIDGADEMVLSKINLKKIFQKPYNIIDDDHFKDKVSNYIDIFNKRIKQELFDENFDENNCFSFIDNLKKSGFVNEDKKRGLTILGKEYYSIDDIEKLFNSTLAKIAADVEIIDKNKELLKSIGSSKEATNLKTDIINNPLLIKELALGKKEIIRISLKNSGLQTKYWIEILGKTKRELSRVLNNVKKKKNLFEQAIDIYNNRFHPVFDVKIDNKQESMLGLEIPYISFRHKRNINRPLEEEQLYDILSSGEKTSLNIIKFLVEYISKKEKKPIIILDDIVETFDYSNRYAFIEYINDMVKEDISIIILTHNFEFYRTLGRRIPRLRKLSAIADKDGCVYIQKNRNLNRNIENILDIQNENNIYFAIPYLREAKMILKEDTSLLDACLHYNKQTEQLLLEDILKYFPNISVDIDRKVTYLSGLKNICDNIRSLDNFDIVKKTILAICCRVLLEAKIINRNFSLLHGIDSYQFVKIKEKYEKYLHQDVVIIMEKVQLSTPEFIHANAFMYEPLVDIDGNYLKELYDEICRLDINYIWKKSYDPNLDSGITEELNEKLSNKSEIHGEKVAQ